MEEWPRPDQLAVYDPARQPARVETTAELRSRTARLRFEDGLAVSPEIVTEVLASNDRNGSSGWFTDAEHQDTYADNERVDRARAVLADAGDVLWRIEVCWSNGSRAVRVLLTDEHDRYREQLAAAIGSERVVVEQAAYTGHQLREFSERVNADAAGLAEQGIYITRTSPTANGLDLAYYAAEFAPADQLLDDRYGAFAKIRYEGASRYAIREQPFGSWHAHENQLYVFYALNRNGEQAGSAPVVEREDSIIVSVTIVDWRGFKTLRGGFVPSHHAVDLRQPLGERIVIDNSQNRARPHWTEAAKTPLPRPQDM